MDPNANLSEIQQIAKEILEARHDQEMTDSDRLESIETSADRLATLITELDNWLLSGGFLPVTWQEVNADREKLILIRRKAKALDEKWGADEHTDTEEANELIQLILSKEDFTSMSATGRTSSGEQNNSNTPKCRHGAVGECSSCDSKMVRHKAMSANFEQVYGRTVDLFESFQGSLEQLRILGPTDDTPVTRRQLERILRGLRDSFPRVRK